MAKKNKKNKKVELPTAFVIDGEIQWFEQGTMLELHCLLTDEDWAEMVAETIKYFVFLECLKTVACPILKESWTEEDDYYRLLLEVAVSRMRNIDPLLVASVNQNTIREIYTPMMQANAAACRQMIEALHNQSRPKDDNIIVSDI